MQEVKPSELTYCKKCGKVCLKKCVSKPEGLCVDCKDEIIIKAIGFENYGKMSVKSRVPVLIQNSVTNKYYTLTVEEAVKMFG